MTGPAVAMKIGGGGPSGSVHSRVVSSLKYLPSCLTSRAAAVEELADDLDRLEHPADPLGRLRPVAADDVLVERLAASRGPATSGPDTSPRASPRPGPRSPGGTGSVGQVTPGPRSYVVRSPRAVSTFQTNAAWPCCGNPRLEVVGGHDALEAARSRRAPSSRRPPGARTAPASRRSRPWPGSFASSLRALRESTVGRSRKLTRCWCWNASRCPPRPCRARRTAVPSPRCRAWACGWCVDDLDGAAERHPVLAVAATAMLTRGSRRRFVGQRRPSRG